MENPVENFQFLHHLEVNYQFQKLGAKRIFGFSGGKLCLLYPGPDPSSKFGT